MSVEAITWAMKRQGLRSSEKFVLVCLANYADESFFCYPSVAALESATSQDRKTVLANLGRLTEAGLIMDTGDRKGVTRSIPVYRLVLEPAISLRSAENGTPLPEGVKQSQFSAEAVPVFPISGPKNGTRIHQDTKGTQPQGASDPANHLTPKTPRSSKGRGVSTEPLPPAPPWVPAEPWAGFVEFRQRSKKPLTARGASLTFRELERLREQGHEPGDVLDQSVQRGWTGVFPIKGEAAPAQRGDDSWKRNVL